jgi:uronate dehydrogenase
MRVTITGAAGRIGRCLTAGLTESGHEVRGIDRVAPEAPAGGPFVVADIGTDDTALARAVEGAAAIVHLAAIAAESSFADAVDTHLRLTHRVLEAAVTHGVGRVVYASSNHVVGFTPRSAMVGVDTPVRPDSFYGVGKAAAEALCSLYHDRHGLAVACLRIGSFRPQPDTRRALSTWLSPADAVRLVDACLRAPDLGFTVVYGISANRRAWWDLSTARALGYEPRDDAETFAASIEATAATPEDDLDGRFLGGSFTRPGADRPR